MSGPQEPRAVVMPDGSIAMVVDRAPSGAVATVVSDGHDAHHWAAPTPWAPRRDRRVPYPQKRRPQLTALEARRLAAAHAELAFHCSVRFARVRGWLTPPASKRAALADRTALSSAAFCMGLAR